MRKLLKWVARLNCGHDAGGTFYEAPEPGAIVWCFTCREGQLIEDVLTDEPEKDPNGKAW